MHFLSSLQRCLSRPVPHPYFPGSGRLIDHSAFSQIIETTFFEIPGVAIQQIPTQAVDGDLQYQKGCIRQSSAAPL